MSLLKVQNWSNNPCDYVRLPIATGVQVKQGDLISYESNTCTVLNAAGDDATFVGLTFTESITGETEPITVCVGPVVVIADVTSATYAFGVGILYSAGAYTTDWSFADDAGANTLGHIWREYTSTVTRAYIRFDAWAIGIGTMFENNT